MNEFIQIKEDGFSNYEINKDGIVRRIKPSRKIINPRLSGHGYLRVSLVNDEGKRLDRYVHRLLMKTLVENPHNLPQINHKDGNKQNNDLNNLEWCTRSENIKHMHSIVNNSKGTSSRPCKLYYMGEYLKSFDKIIDACEYANTYYSISYTSLQKYYTSNGLAIIFD